MSNDHLIYGQEVLRAAQTINSMTFGEATLVTGLSTSKIAELRRNGKILCPSEPNRVYVALFIGDNNTRAFGLIRSESTGDMPTVG